MASSLLRIMCTCVIILLGSMDTFVVEGGRRFKVGDDLGWHEPVPNNTVFYIRWAERNRFQVGDSLIFVYQNDSVLTVDKKDYFTCDTSNPITAFDNGESILNLDMPGPFYFISGTENHCTNGQKLLVEVMSPHPKSSPPSYASDDSFEDSISASASVVLGPVPMASIVTFVIVLHTL
ncbi:hypothetical protein TanjilG_06004 [Lupinus angustifolius]|uniref:Phytocyanin domain-containing protein n=1 Tax=Lupinus angustifolius TaxID=3871 RepID=A0A4P1RE43_LUPAN|nr:PREDICTED: mavicyanin-like [Lupinus angustifolius]OIW09028.1 hypothetical protein TanjilG_06004 [Lupinus angustifolius]